MKLLVVGNPVNQFDIAVYLGEMNIPFITAEELRETKPDAEKVLVIQDDTKLSDLMRVIELEKTNIPILIEALPCFDQTDYIPTIKELNKPFMKGFIQRVEKKEVKNLVDRI